VRTFGSVASERHYADQPADRDLSSFRSSAIDAQAALRLVLPNKDRLAMSLNANYTINAIVSDSVSSPVNRAGEMSSNSFSRPYIWKRGFNLTARKCLIVTRVAPAIPLCRCMPSGGRHMWIHRFPAFTRAGFRCIVIDWRHPNPRSATGSHSTALIDLVLVWRGAERACPWHRDRWRDRISICPFPSRNGRRPGLCEQYRVCNRPRLLLCSACLVG
jgi:hypothetical protein